LRLHLTAECRYKAEHPLVFTVGGWSIGRAERSDCSWHVQLPPGRHDWRVFSGTLTAWSVLMSKQIVTNFYITLTGIICTPNSDHHFKARLNTLQSILQYIYSGW